MKQVEIFKVFKLDGHYKRLDAIQAKRAETDGVKSRYARDINGEIFLVSQKMALVLANTSHPVIIRNNAGLITKKSIKDVLDWIFVNHDYESGNELATEERQLFSLLIENAVRYQQQLGRPLNEKEVKSLYGLHICMNHGGKMEHIHSLSTNSMLNPFCIAHAKLANCVCSHCYAVSLIKSRPSMFIPLTINQLLLSNYVLPVEILPVINNELFRFESFGDLGSVNQVTNYLNIAGKPENANIKFALWTKNPLIIKEALKAGARKPETLQIVFSGFRLNVHIDVESIKKVFPFVDRVFIVWETDENNPRINCGKRDCNGCRACYSENGNKTINEALKMTKKGDK